MEVLESDNIILPLSAQLVTGGTTIHKGSVAECIRTGEVYHSFSTRMDLRAAEFRCFSCRNARILSSSGHPDGISGAGYHSMDSSLRIPADP